jgi:proteasome lid subunit RPN8/RPN11
VIATPVELEQIRRHAEADYPRECCGVILARASGHRLLMACRNIQDALHARDPVKHPRDARTAYHIDPQDLLQIGRKEDEGYQVSVIYHSHCDAGAYFSETDKRDALLGGDPAYPEAVYLVVSVLKGRVALGAAFQWNGDCRDFQPVDFKGFA